MKTFIALVAGALLLIANPLRAEPSATLELTVDGLVCAFCAQGIEKKLRAQPATADVFVSLEDHLVAVALKSGQDLAEDALRKLLTESGYTLRAYQHSDVPLATLRARAEAP